MAIGFNKLKSSLLAPTDVLAFGKFSGCRVCDIVEDNYEYLIWAEKAGLVKYSRDTIAMVLKVANFELEKQHYEEEIKPYLDSFEDVPDLTIFADGCIYSN